MVLFKMNPAGEAAWEQEKREYEADSSRPRTKVQKGSDESHGKKPEAKGKRLDNESLQ